MRFTESEIINRLESSSDRYEPLKIVLCRIQPSSTETYCPDAKAEISISNGSRFKALIEILTLATPKNLLIKSKILADYVSKTKKSNVIVMIVAPYISPKQALILAEQKISWLDLCGNMKIEVLDKVYIERTGNKNRFPDTVAIKNIFQGTSSIVSRALLLKQDGFTSQNKLVDFINSRNANITASTVSRVLKSLQEELLINKTKSLISVTDAEKLLDNLLQGYKYSTERKTRKKYRFASENFEKLSSTLFPREVDYAICEFYAAKQKSLVETEEISVFVQDIERFKNKCKKQLVNLEPDSEYGNITIIETKDPAVWFNININIEPFIVDDIELHLELMLDTPRGPKVAKELKKRILKRQDNE